MKKENLKKLENVLLAYSRRNDSVGYCQGFNFIVGRILLDFPNEVRILRYYYLGRCFLAFYRNNREYTSSKLLSGFSMYDG